MSGTKLEYKHETLEWVEWVEPEWVERNGLNEIRGPEGIGVVGIDELVNDDRNYSTDMFTPSGRI